MFTGHESKINKSHQTFSTAQIPNEKNCSTDRMNTCWIQSKHKLWLALKKEKVNA